MKTRILAVLSIAVGLVGCAKSSDTTLSAKDGAAAKPKTTTTYPHMPAPDVTNRSDRSTALGRLCWVHIELDAKLVALALSANEKASKDSATSEAFADLRDFASRTDEFLGSSDGLPVEAAEFHSALRQMTARVAAELKNSDGSTTAGRKTAYERVASKFDWTRMPGANGYLDSARRDTHSCPFAAG